MDFQLQITYSEFLANVQKLWNNFISVLEKQAWPCCYHLA